VKFIFWMGRMKTRDGKNSHPYGPRQFTEPLTEIEALRALRFEFGDRILEVWPVEQLWTRLDPITGERLE